MKRKDNLDGLTGVVLLMFAGRETYTTRFSSELTPRFYQNIENVDQAVRRLEKEGYLKTIHKDVVERGAPKYRTASPKVLKMLLDTVKKAGGETYTEQLFKDLSAVSPYFPEYLATVLEAGKVTKLPWDMVFGNYLTFGLQVLGLLMSEEKMEDAKNLEIEVLNPAIKALEKIDAETRQSLISRYGPDDIRCLTTAAMVLLLGKNGPKMFQQVAKMMFGSDSSIL